MREYKKYITVPNILTAVRIVCGLSLIFVAPMGFAFFVLYLICGFTDAIDGTIARMTGTASEFGKKLDSVADLLFYSVMIIRFFPMLLKTVSGHIWFAVILIVIIRASLYLYFALRHRTFVSNHTYLNKLTGFVVFLLPFVVNTSGFGIYSIIVCIIAMVATLWELVLCFNCKKEMI